MVSLIDAALSGVGPLGALAGIGAGPGEALLAAALAAVCWWAAADGVRGIRGVAVVGAGLVIVQTAASAMAAVATSLLIGGSGAARGAELIVRLTWLVIPAIAAGVLVRAARVADSAGSAEDVPAGEVTLEVPAPVEQPYREAAGWEPDEAAGAVWTSAGDAAAGAAAAGWGSAASAGGWGAGVPEPDSESGNGAPTSDRSA